MGIGVIGLVLVLQATSAASMPPGVPAPEAAASPCVFLKSGEPVDNPDDPAELFMRCRDVNLALGPTLGFESSYNPTLGRYLILNRTPAGQQVLLVKPGTKGQAVVEEIGTDLARASGARNSAQIAIDARAFASTGVLAVRSAAVDAGDLTGKSEGAEQRATAAPTTSVKLIDVGGMVRVRTGS